MHPKLRPLDVRPVAHGGQSYILLRDPQQLTGQQLLIPQPIATILAYCDGHHSIDDIVVAFRRRFALDIPVSAVQDLIAALDEAAMLANARAATAHARALQAYRQAPFRPTLLAGASYPADEKELWNLLQHYLEEADVMEPLSIDWTRGTGILSPHIDYPRGSAVYAQVWQRAAQAAREAELVIFFGTDHYGSDLFTLTRQSYGTPYGTLPTEVTLVDQLAAIIGEEQAFAGELRHQGEHSLELVAVWLHHMRSGAPVPVVPILVGSFHPFIFAGLQPVEHPAVADLLETLRKQIPERRVLVVASGDLAHVGPAFGGRPLDAAGQARLRAADESLLAAMTAGAASQFFANISAIRDENNVCGVAPIYLTMSLLGATNGKQAGYAVCPADDHNTSVVSIAGMIFT